MDKYEIVKIMAEVAGFLVFAFGAGVKLSSIEKKSDAIAQEMQAQNKAQGASLAVLEQKLTDRISSLDSSLKARMDLDNEKSDHNITKKLDGIDKRISSMEIRLESIESASACVKASPKVRAAKTSKPRAV